MTDTPRSNESIWSVPPEWKVAYVCVFFTLFLGGIVFSIWYETFHIVGDDLPATCWAIMGDMVESGMWAGLSSMFMVLGGSAAVTIHQYFQARRERKIQEARELGREEGRELGRKEGREEGYEQALRDHNLKKEDRNPGH